MEMKNNLDKLAKNLLEGKICRVCENSRGNHCILNTKESNFAFSEEGTCELWKERDKMTQGRIKTLGEDAALLLDTADKILEQYKREQKEKQKNGRSDLETSKTTPLRKNRRRI